MRILIPLFSPATGTWGGLTRVVAIAQAASSAGHEVAFCASGYLQECLSRRGYRVFPTPPTTMFGLPGPLSRLIERRSQHASLPIKPGRSVGSIWLVLLISGLARAGYLHRLLAAEQEAARDFDPEALFTDLDPGAFLLSAICGLPIASAYQGVMAEGTGSIPYCLMRRAVRAVLRAHGKTERQPEEVFFGPSVLKIIPSIPELDGTDPSRPDVRYVGQLLGGVQAPAIDDFRPEPGRRYVFVYVGTGALPLGALRAVLPQVFPSGSKVSCIVGAQAVERPEHLGEVRFLPYVPAEALLPQCDWTICHGGQNTIVQSLLFGVPLLVFPGPIFERRFNARMVQESGAGLMGEAPDYRADWLRVALGTREVCAARAVALGDRIRAYGGAAAAVDALVGWARRDRQPSAAASIDADAGHA